MIVVNRDRVQLLVDALESGEFEQGKGALRLKEHGKYYHCCLGVATEVALRNGLSDQTNSGTVWINEVGEVLCDEVRDWYGFNSRSPVLTGQRPSGPYSTSAHQWNDSYDANFHEIADMFRKKYLGDGTETPASD